jgi:hypothetical protein
MYKDSEILITLGEIGTKDSTNYIPINSEVTFIKSVYTDDISKSFILIEFNGKKLLVPELSVRKRNNKEYKKHLKAFNRGLYKSNPRLRVYHTNVILRLFYKFYYFIKDIFVKPTKRVNLERVKKIVNEE